MDGASDPPLSLVEKPAAVLLREHPTLVELRRRYATCSAEERRMAADLSYHQAAADFVFGEAVGEPERFGPVGSGELAALAIDPSFAPAVLTVASIEYQCGRVEGAMALFLELPALADPPEDLVEIVDKAGDFLVDQGDLASAERLFRAAAEAYPDVTTYHVGVGYCAAKQGRKEEAVAHHRRAVDREPTNPDCLNDLGWSLVEAEQYDEAVQVLKMAVGLGPDRTRPDENLDYALRCQAGGDTQPEPRRKRKPRRKQDDDPTPFLFE